LHYVYVLRHLDLAIGFHLEAGLFHKITAYIS
jgi:hypothetical protein